MKYIKFCEEVLRVPENVTFWVMNQGNDYACQYCVNMSYLEKQNAFGEPSRDSIIRSEGYKTSKEAHQRLDELLNILNS